MNNLKTVKSIVTLMLTAVFCYLSVVKVISAEMFMTVFTVVIGFYFGTQKIKDYVKEEQNDSGSTD